MDLHVSCSTLRASLTILIRDLGLGTKPPTTSKSILDKLDIIYISSTALSRSKIKRAGVNFGHGTTCKTKERSKSIALFKIKNYTSKLVFIYTIIKFYFNSNNIN